MATFRVGVGSFNIKDGAVGFGTDTDGLGNLKVKGVTKTTDIKVSGASTLTRYSGFAADNISQLENITLTSEVGTIGDIVVGVGTSVIISSGSTVTVGTVESVSIGTHFSPPVGGIEDRGQDFVEGMMRFNTDLNTMEFYNGNEWRQFNYQTDVINGGIGLKMIGKTYPNTPGVNLTKLPQKTETNKRSFKEVLALLFKVLGKSKSLGLTILAGTLYHFVLGAAAFDIRWAVVDKGFEADFYLQINSLVFLVFGVAGSVFGGAMSDWALKKYNLPRTWFLLILTFVLMPLAFTRYADPTSVIFWIGIVSSAFSTGCFYGPVFSAIQEVVPANIRGSVVAFNLLCINLVGYSLGSYTAGLSIDYLLEIGVSQPYTHVLVASVVIYLLTGPICYYLAGKHYDADKKALEMQFSKET